MDELIVTNFALVLVTPLIPEINALDNCCKLVPVPEPILRTCDSATVPGLFNRMFPVSLEL